MTNKHPKKLFGENRPLVAILRGVEPDEVVSVGKILVERGIGIIEVPLNSPSPLLSIERLSDSLGDAAIIGAGTVMTPDEVDSVSSAGGRLIVSPNVNVSVIERSRSRDCLSCPGVFTPTESFLALSAGADSLKIFPADVLGVDGVRAYRSVLPPDTHIMAVGGITHSNISDWRGVVDGFGIGSGLFKIGDSLADIETKAKKIVSAYDSNF